MVCSLIDVQLAGWLSTLSLCLYTQGFVLRSFFYCCVFLLNSKLSQWRRIICIFVSFIIFFLSIHKKLKKTRDFYAGWLHIQKCLVSVIYTLTSLGCLFVIYILCSVVFFSSLPSHDAPKCFFMCIKYLKNSCCFVVFTQRNAALRVPPELHF